MSVPGTVLGWAQHPGVGAEGLVPPTTAQPSWFNHCREQGDRADVALGHGDRPGEAGDISSQTLPHRCERSSGLISTDEPILCFCRKMNNCKCDLWWKKEHHIRGVHYTRTAPGSLEADLLSACRADAPHKMFLLRPGPI